jgi:hypothetical protein
VLTFAGAEGTLDALEVNRTEDAVQQVYQGSVRRDRHDPIMTCLSRVPRRVARTVLRGPRCSNASGLPDRGTGRTDKDLLRFVQAAP